MADQKALCVCGHYFSAHGRDTHDRAMCIGMRQHPDAPEMVDFCMCKGFTPAPIEVDPNAPTPPTPPSDVATTRNDVMVAMLTATCGVVKRALTAHEAAIRADERAKEPDPTMPDDPHVDRLVALITRSLAGGGCSNCGSLPHSTTCRVGRLAAAFGWRERDVLRRVREEVAILDREVGDGQ